jgi:hypothetical protein
MFYGSFNNWEDVLGHFEVSDTERFRDVCPLFATYDCEAYEGSASVLFIEKGKIWAVFGSHCSCYGLEGQWDPEDMPLSAIQHILEKGDYQFSGRHAELGKVLEFFEEKDLLDLDPKQLEFMLRMYLK